MRSEDVGGVHIKYLHHCHRQLWLFARGIRPEQYNETVQYGQAIHDLSYPRHHPVDLGANRLDSLDSDGWVHETKSSTTPRPADQAQARHYCHQLHQLGVPVAGAILHYPATRRTIRVPYTPEAAQTADQDTTTVLAIIDQPDPPERLERSRCRGCSFTDYCWTE